MPTAPPVLTVIVYKRATRPVNTPPAAIVPDGSRAPEPIDPIRVYQPSTAPGHPLPHAWLDADDGRRLSTLDLVRPGRFLLIAGDSEVEEGTVTVSQRGVEEQTKVPFDEFAERAKQLVATRSLELG